MRIPNFVRRGDGAPRVTSLRFDQPTCLVDVDMTVTAVPGNGIRSGTSSLDMRGVG